MNNKEKKEYLKELYTDEFKKECKDIIQKLLKSDKDFKETLSKNLCDITEKTAELNLSRYLNANLSDRYYCYAGWIEDLVKRTIEATVRKYTADYIKNIIETDGIESLFYKLKINKK